MAELMNNWAQTRRHVAELGARGGAVLDLSLDPSQGLLGSSALNAGNGHVAGWEGARVTPSFGALGKG